MVNARSRLLPVLCVSLFLAADVGAQPRVGALAIDEGQGDQYGWAVDHQTAAAAREAALRECGAGCSVLLTFDRCGTSAADQDNAATALGWGESAAPAGSSAQENLFWQSIMNSTSPAEFEAYPRRFPNGVFSELAEARLAALRGWRVPAAPAGAGIAAGAEMRTLPGVAFRSDETCLGKPAGTPCWMEIAQRSPACYVWTDYLHARASVTRTGDCAGGLAQGAGTLTDLRRKSADGNWSPPEWKVQRPLDHPLRRRDRPGRPFGNDERNGDWSFDSRMGTSWKALS